MGVGVPDGGETTTDDAAGSDAAGGGAASGEAQDATAGRGAPARVASVQDATAGPGEAVHRPRDVEATVSLTELIWRRAADALLVRTRPQFGERVLETGTGAAAAAAADLVGPDGLVDAVLPDPTLALHAQEESDSGLRRLGLHRQSLASWEVGGYDVVQSPLALDVVDAAESERIARDLVGRLRPGGRAGFAVWTGRAFAELLPALVEAAAPFDAALGAADAAALGPSVRHVGEAGSFGARIGDLGLVDVHVDELPRRIEVDGDLAWRLVEGTELVRLLDGVDGEDLPEVREAFVAALARDGVASVDVSTYVATGVRAG